jgi:hypothetical protein
MYRKAALFAAALVIALPAFADNPKATDNATTVPVSHGSAPKKAPKKTWANGTEVHPFNYEVKTPTDKTGQPVGKRKHPIPVQPPK